MVSSSKCFSLFVNRCLNTSVDTVFYYAVTDLGFIFFNFQVMFEVRCV